MIDKVESASIVNIPPCEGTDLRDPVALSTSDDSGCGNRALRDALEAMPINNAIVPDRRSNMIQAV